MLESFSYEALDKLLGHVGRDRPFLRFRDTKEGNWPESFVLLRHDVDHSPEMALALAEREAARHVTATYFFMLTSSDYNLLAREWSGIPRRIARLGHEVGLHYDPIAMDEAAVGKSPQEFLEAQASLLSDLVGQPVRSIARHQPSRSGGDPFERTTSYINAYHPSFTTGVAYFSDSCGAWRDASYAALTSDTLPPRMQLLIHPIFWAEGESDRWQRFEAFFAERRQRLAREQASLRSICAQYPGVLEHDRRIAASANASHG